MIVKAISTHSPLGTQTRNAPLVKDAKLQALDCLDTFLPFLLGLTPKTKSYIATSWISFSALLPQIPKVYSAEAHGSHHLNTDWWQSGGSSHI